MIHWVEPHVPVKAELVPDREWLHIQIVNDDVYVFTDDAHWKGNPSEHWEDGLETSFKALDGECFVGSVHGSGYRHEDLNVKRFDIRIRLKPAAAIMRYTKFGLPYWET